jgi:hypothetical protein
MNIDDIRVTREPRVLAKPNRDSVGSRAVATVQLSSRNTRPPRTLGGHGANQSRARALACGCYRAQQFNIDDSIVSTSS